MMNDVTNMMDGIGWGMGLVSILVILVLVLLVLGIAALIKYLLSGKSGT